MTHIKPVLGPSGAIRWCHRHSQYSRQSLTVLATAHSTRDNSHSTRDNSHSTRDNSHSTLDSLIRAPQGHLSTSLSLYIWCFSPFAPQAGCELWQEARQVQGQPGSPLRGVFLFFGWIFCLSECLLSGGMMWSVGISMRHLYFRMGEIPKNVGELWFVT